MKKSILIAAICGLFIATGCETSQKGKWTSSDKERARKEVTEALQNEDFGDTLLKKQYIDCYLQKVENNFKSFLEADSDSTTCEKLAMECVADLLKNMQAPAEEMVEEPAATDSAAVAPVE